MYLRRQKKANGRVYLSIVQSYRSMEGKPRSKTLWSLGYLDELEESYADPIAHFQEVIEELNRAHSDEITSVNVSYSKNARIPFGQGHSIEAGSAIAFAFLHRDLHIGNALKRCCNQHITERALVRTVELLAWNRIVRSQTAIEAYSMRSRIPGMSDLARDELFRAIAALGTDFSELRKLVNEAMRDKRHVRGHSQAYCFVTNYYVEGTRYDKPDFAKPWQNRDNPIVQLALMTDMKGMPLDYAVFCASLATPLSSFPAMVELAERHPDTRLIVISRKAIGADSYELGELSDRGFGFILPQSLRRGKHDSRTWIIDANGYNPLDDSGSCCKHRMDVRSIEGYGIRKHSESIAVKEVAAWLRDEYESTRFNRFRVVKRTENVFANGLPSEGTTRPIRAIYGSGDAKPGEISDRVWQVYWDKIAADEAMDGYVDLVTSELDLSETHVLELYRKLDALQAAFAPMPGEWSTCPDWLSRNRYIQAHIFVCYLASCTKQLIWESVDAKLADDSFLDALVRLTGFEISPGQYFFNYRSHLSDRLAEAAGIDLSHSLMSTPEISRMLHQVRQE